MSSRPGLVFAHYFGGSARSWEPLVAALGDGVDCVVPDLPGFGGTAMVPTPGLDAYADALLGHAPDGPWLAVGHSMGGKIALAAALRRPPGLVGLILIATSPPTPEPMSEAERRKTLATFGERAAATENLTKISAGRLTPDRLATCIDDELRVDRAAWDWWLERGSRDDILHATAALALPVLVITGDCDTVLGPDTAPRVAAALPDARLTTIADGGHLLPLERPAAVAAAIRSFAACL